LGYPGELENGIELWYYLPSGAAHATGYLFEKVQTQRKKYLFKNKKKRMNLGGFQNIQVYILDIL